MGSVDHEKAYDRVPQNVLWGMLWDYGVDGLLFQAIQSLCCQSQSLVHIAGSKSEQEIDRWIGATLKVMQTVKRSIYVPTLTHGHELCVVTKIMRL